MPTRLTIRNSDGTCSQPTNLKWAEALEKTGRLTAFLKDCVPAGKLKYMEEITLPEHINI